MIKLNNITKIFTLPDKKLTALDNVSLHVPKGQICGVIGASGAGKSTLIRCVNLLERPTHGAVLIDDVDLTQLSEAELVKTRRQIGMIFQHFNLLTSRTVFAHNISIFSASCNGTGCRLSIESTYKAMLRRLFADEIPDKS